ncbi:MAG: hypothetical protein ACKV0T_16045 [Planctomycetales bacterium]
MRPAAAAVVTREKSAKPSTAPSPTTLRVNPPPSQQPTPAAPPAGGTRPASAAAPAGPTGSATGKPASATVRTEPFTPGENRLSQAEFQAALEHQHPQHYTDVRQRFMLRVGRVTARLLNSNPEFIDKLKNGDWKGAGNQWHNTADRVLKKMVKSGKAPRELQVESEKTLKDGKGGSRVDAIIADLKRQFAIFDYKTNAKSALKSGPQADKHSDHTEKHPDYGAKPTVHQAINWVDLIRKYAPNAASHIPATGQPKSAGATKSAARGAHRAVTGAAKPSASGMAVNPTAKSTAKSATKSTGGKSTGQAVPQGSPPIAGRAAAAQMRVLRAGGGATGTSAAPTAKPLVVSAPTAANVKPPTGSSAGPQVGRTH